MSPHKHDVPSESENEIIHTILGPGHRTSFQQHVEQATRNLSVDVHHSLERSNNRTRSRQRIFWTLLGTAGVITSLLLLIPATPTSEQLEVQNNNIGFMKGEVTTEAFLSDMIDDEFFDHLTVPETQPTLIVTNDDIDNLLEGLEE